MKQSKWCWKYLVAVVMCIGMHSAMAQQETQLMLSEGRIETGRVTKSGSMVILKDGVRTLYLSPAIIEERRKVEASDPVPIYKLNQEKLKGLGPRKKLNLVQGQFRWGPRQPGGTLTFSSVDPKFGAVQGTLVITRISPTTVHYECLEYIYTLDFPTRDHTSTVRSLVRGQIDFDKAEDWVKAIHFSLLLGDHDRAAEFLEGLSELEGQAALHAKWQSKVNESKLRASLDEVERLRMAWLHRKSDALMRRITPRSDLKQNNAVLFERYEKLKTQLDEERRILNDVVPILNQAGLKASDYALPSLLQLHTIFHGGNEANYPEDGGILKAAMEAWAAVLAGEDPLTNEQWALAMQLAGESKAYFNGEQKASDLEALAKRFKASALPVELKCSILSFARDYPSPPPTNWEKVLWRHPREKIDFYYCVELPPQYDPRRAWPVLITMHGMHGKAEYMQSFWRGAAARWGVIVLSPEYIYGREWGYMNSDQEHRAVFGALEHAAKKLNIDMDRVFLHGQSQGGHAAWDMGSGQAGRLAGVIPVIGAPFWDSTHGNYLDTSLYVIDGELDDGAPIHNRRAMKKLAQMKADARYIEYDGRKHEAFSEEHDVMFRWLHSKRRPELREQVNLYALRQGNVWRDWVKIESSSKRMPVKITRIPPPQPALVKGVWGDGEVKLSTKGVRSLVLYFPASLAKVGDRIQIQLNRKRVKHTVEEDWALALRIIRETGDRQSIYLDQLQLRP